MNYPVKVRRDALKRLYKEIICSASEIEAAEKADFNKCAFDVYATEIGLVLREIKHFIKNIYSYARVKRVPTGIADFPSRGYIYPEPYGKVLIIAPWNYPFLLSLSPLIGAVAAGNSVTLKPSTKTPRTFEVIRRIVTDVFDKDRVVVTDGRDLLDKKWDFIFFTGSRSMGKEVMRKAAENLTPVTLELGGKSPCIVDESAPVGTTARRIAWGKFLNAGQTCIAPDYICVHRGIKDEFVERFVSEIKAMYYDERGRLSDDFAQVVSEEKVSAILSLIDEKDIIFGGKASGRTMEPTVINADFSHPLMQDEIFAPVAPIIVFDDISELKNRMETTPALEKPLALYYFGKNFDAVKDIPFGGGAVGDTVMHIAEEDLPFGGVGNSGMGSYHGKKSFDTFTHYKSVLKKGKAEIKLRYPPHTDKKKKTLEKLLK